MNLPEQFLLSLQNIKGLDKNALKKVHESKEQVTSVRLNPSKLSIANCRLPIDKPVSWSTQGYYLKERPSFTFDPLFHALF